jgi:hypothetical protein
MKRGLIFLLLIGLTVLAGCNLPVVVQSDDLDPASATIVAQTVAAAQAQAGDGSDSGNGAGDGGGDDQAGSDTNGEGQIVPTATQKSEDDGEHGTDQARFISDVTIQDYANVDPEEEITKTWRLQNVGTATWTTDYALVFEDEDQLGAPDRVNLPSEVPPDGFINISVDFTMPETAGEYKSYWVLENDRGETFGTGEDYDQPIWMIVVVSSDELQTGSSSTGIAGGAGIVDGTVSATTINYSGSCPAQITFTYSGTTSSEGVVNIHLIFTTISPSGWVFDDPGVYSQTVTGPATLTYQYLFIPGSSVTATARVQVVGATTYTSPPLQFSVNCN